MRIGAVYPQTELPEDPAVIREYAQTAEGLGYAHVLAYDHVLGANPDRAGGFRGPYTYQSSFMEPLTLFAFMAAVTERLEFTTGILILPQRQTALVAKQAATLDVLSGGRTRLGVGLGWNKVEYEALDQDFHTRGRRIEEQVALLRRLWTEPLVRFAGRWDSVPDAGLKPLPVQRPIPIWFGGYVDAVLRRVARMGDGWMPGHRRPADARPDLEKLTRYIEEAGRAPAEVGLEPRLSWSSGGLDEQLQLLAGWQELGATHITLNTMGCGFDTPGAHLQALETFARSAGLDGRGA